MSAWTYGQTPFEILVDLEISDGATRLYSYLSFRQGAKGCCWPSIARMQKDLGKGRSTIMRYLDELESAGYVDHHHQERRNVYRVLSQKRDIKSTECPTDGTLNVPQMGHRTIEINENIINMPDAPNPNTVVKAMQELLDYTIPNWGREAGVAKKLLETGYTTEEIIECWKYTKQEDFWQDKHCSLTAVVNRIGPWRKNKRKSDTIYIDDTRFAGGNKKTNS